MYQDAFCVVVSFSLEKKSSRAGGLVFVVLVDHKVMFGWGYSYSDKTGARRSRS